MDVGVWKDAVTEGREEIVTACGVSVARLGISKGCGADAGDDWMRVALDVNFFEVLLWCVCLLNIREMWM